MTRVVLALVALSTLPATMAGPVAPPREAPSPRALADLLDSLMAGEMARQHIPGAAIVFVQGGRVLFQRAYGMANIEARRPIDLDSTLFRIGSVSKVFTATAVVQLADRGRLQLDADVNRYLTRVKVPATFADPVTPAHLLSHTAGFDEIGPGRQAPTAGAVLPLHEFLRERLVRIRPPGIFPSYSTYGITLAGLLVEEISGVPYERYLADNLWRPLAMRRTMITVPATDQRQLAIGYEYIGGRDVPQPYEWYHTIPASSINSTMADMGRFMLMHLALGKGPGGDVLSRRAAMAMQRSQARGHPDIPGFTYGFFETNDNGERIVEHGGNMAGFASLLVLLPERDAGFFVVHHHEASDLRTRVKTAILDRFYPDPVRRTVSGPSGDSLAAARFGGMYRWSAFCHTCPDAARGQGPTVTANGDGSLGFIGQRWFAIRPGLFLAENGKKRIAFGADSTGRVTSLFIDGPVSFEKTPR